MSRITLSHRSSNLKCVQFVQRGWKKNCSGLGVLVGKGETSQFLGFRDRLTIPKSQFWGSEKYSTGSKANSF